MVNLFWYIRLCPGDASRDEGDYYTLESHHDREEAEQLPGFIQHRPEITGPPTPEQWAAILVDVAELMGEPNIL